MGPIRIPSKPGIVVYPQQSIHQGILFMAQFMWGKANILIPDRGRTEAKSSQEVAQCLGERERLGAFMVPIFPRKKKGSRGATILIGVSQTTW